MIGTLQQTLQEIASSGVYDFTENGECSNCGQCCSNFLPISQKEAGTIALYVKKHRIQENKHRTPTAEPVIDMTCPFRDDREKKCSVYPVRPAICRDFRCDKPKAGIMANRDMYQAKYGVADMREMFFLRSKKHD